MDAILETLPEIDHTLIRTIDEDLYLNRKKFTLVSPFTGKDYAWPKYLASLKKLPTEDAHAVFYDNSRDPEFQKKLRKALHEHFDSFTLIEDLNAPATLDTHPKIETWQYIANRCAQVYRVIYENHVPRQIRKVFNLEDDIGLPANTWKHLNSVLDLNPQVATAIGHCNDRRPGYTSSGKPVAMNYHVHRLLGDGNLEPESIVLELVPEKKFGVEQVGGGHMGCWLTRTAAIEQVAMGSVEFLGVMGQDLAWGWDLLQTDRWIMATDWAVKCKHWRKLEGKKLEAV